MLPEVTNYMRMALNEAVFSIGVSRPNPAVGAVVVKDGIVVGKGRTQRPGSAHAEVMALRDAGELARGAAIYVTLEPCCHYGRTPPCTKAIIDAGIAKVYYAHGDPNPVVRGNSRKILEEAGIEVFEGVDACTAAEIEDGWEDACSGGECHCLSAGQAPRSTMANVILSEARSAESKNLAGSEVFHDVERYFEAYDYFVRNKRTFVEVKCAVSQDGFMGAVAIDGSHLPIRITGESANCWNHELRAISDAVLVGAGTLLSDNPSLNVRNAAGNDPVKIIWAGHHEFTAEEIERLAVFTPCYAEPSRSHPRLDRESGESNPECRHESCDGPSISKPARHPERSATREVEGSCVPNTDKKTLVFSCVPQPAIVVADCAEVAQLSAATFAENWTLMIDNLSARGMHRLMVEPGAGLAKQLFASSPSSVEGTSSKVGDKVGELAEPAEPWNRLNIWRSTDCRIDDIIAELTRSGNIKDGLEFPELPKDLVAKESFMAGPDVLTVFYPA